MRLDDYTVVSLDQDMPTFGSTCALLRWHVHRGPQRLVLDIRHVPLVIGTWYRDIDGRMSNDVSPEDPINVSRYHIVMALN